MRPCIGPSRLDDTERNVAFVYSAQRLKRVAADRGHSGGLRPVSTRPTAVVLARRQCGLLVRALFGETRPAGFGHKPPLELLVSSVGSGLEGRRSVFASGRQHQTRPRWPIRLTFALDYW